MKKIIVVILCLLSFYAKSQRVILEEKVYKYHNLFKKTTWETNVFKLYISAPIPYGDFISYDYLWTNSNAFAFEIKFYPIERLFLSGDFYTYHRRFVPKDSLVSMPKNAIRPKICINYFGITPNLGVNFGNSILLKTGFFTDYVFYSSLKITTKDNLYSKLAKIKYENPLFINKFAYGLKIEFGFEYFSFFAKYYLSSTLKNSQYLLTNKDLPQTEFGFVWYIF